MDTEKPFLIIGAYRNNIDKIRSDAMGIWLTSTPIYTASSPTAALFPNGWFYVHPEIGRQGVVGPIFEFSVAEPKKEIPVIKHYRGRSSPWPFYRIFQK